MCGRYSLVCIDDLGNRFRVHDPAIGFRSRFNVAPSQEMPVIVLREKNEIVPMQWGLTPGGIRTLSPGTPIINARIETLFEKPMFRNLLGDGRCLVPASGFFEWKSEGRRKIPFYIHIRNRPLVAFAGLYELRTDPGGQIHQAYTIITTQATGHLAEIHDRMPVILDSNNEGTWLSERPESPEDLDGFLSGITEPDLEIYPVSGHVSDPKNDDCSLIRPLPRIGM